MGHRIVVPETEHEESVCDETIIAASDSLESLLGEVFLNVYKWSIGLFRDGVACDGMNKLGVRPRSATILRPARWKNFGSGLEKWVCSDNG